MTQSTILSTGRINGADTITIELIQPDSMPAVVRIVWPTAPTITTPARYLEVTSAAMRLLAESVRDVGSNQSESMALTCLDTIADFVIAFGHSLKPRCFCVPGPGANRDPSL